jgi:hypothetical protein
MGVMHQVWSEHYATQEKSFAAPSNRFAFHKPFIRIGQKLNIGLVSERINV